MIFLLLSLFSVLMLFDSSAVRYVKVRSAAALAESRSPTHLMFGWADGVVGGRRVAVLNNTLPTPLLPR